VLESRVFPGNSRTTHLGPFGELIRATGPLAFANPFLFQTEFYDWETGKYYWKNRYYDPGTGRWLTRDPIGTAGGVNLYGYCENNPVFSSDSSGYMSKCWTLFWTILAAFAACGGMFFTPFPACIFVIIGCIAAIALAWGAFQDCNETFTPPRGGPPFHGFPVR